MGLTGTAGALHRSSRAAKDAEWRKPYPAPVMVWSAVAATLAATLLCAWGFGLAPIPWPEIALIWGYSLAWSFQTDWAKRAVYRHLGHNAPCHVCLIGLLKRSTVRGVP